MKFLTCLCIGLLLLSCGCPKTNKVAELPTTESHEEQHEEGTVKLSKEALEQADIALTTVEKVSGRLLPVTGTIEASPNGVVQVTAQVSGRVVRLYAATGNTVRVGESLIEIASNELANAQREFRQAVSRRAAAENALARQGKLAGLGEFGRPRVEEAQTAASAATGNVNTATSELTRSEAELAEAKSEQQTKQAVVQQAEAKVKVARTRRDRAERLLKEELISLQEAEQVRADAESAEADIKAAMAELMQAEAHITSASADKRVAQARLTQAEQQAHITRQALARGESIYKGDYFTSRELVEAETALEQARNEERSATETVRLLGGVPGGGNVLTVKSPLAGQITEQTVTSGQTVRAEDVLLRVINLQSVTALLSVFPSEASAVRIGQMVQVQSDTAPGRTFPGRISAIGGNADAATGALRVRVVVENQGSLLRPGVFVSGQIQTGQRGKVVLLLPTDAVQEMEGQKVVFVPGEEEGEFHTVPVVVTQEIAGGKVAIERGLTAGQKVVGRNAFTLKAQAMKSELGEGHAH